MRKPTVTFNFFRSKSTDQDSQTPLAQAQKGIKAGWITAFISAFVMLLLSLYRGTDLGLSIYNLIDVFVTTVCAFGMYRKSRVAATAMFSYFVLAKLLQIYNGDINLTNIHSMWFGILVFSIYYSAMKSTYTYQRLTNNVSCPPLIPIKEQPL